MLSGKKRFHRYHGSNIVLRSGNTIACRKQSYADAIVFSESPLEPNDLFLLEIDVTERGWSGDMRIGLTKMNPHGSEHSLILPEHALPDLAAIYPSWIFAVSKSFIFNRRRRSLHENEVSLTTAHGIVPLRAVFPLSDVAEDRCATDVGSQIGLVYVPVTEVHAELHVIVNGVDQGAFANDIPYEDPLYVVVDVYGCTKQVRIIQVKCCVFSLQEMCRKAILEHIKESGVAKLPLPKALKDYLLKCQKH